ncbi:fungal-specific transcription factor domain-containing protein [Aspergillus keveii]|uniref:Fungal-specific transcription factor domain-containing protein n=1 Tax=Aspergillus keveii TaxID=714993 RepID=A0ABR4FN64_9EURO
MPSGLDNAFDEQLLREMHEPFLFGSHFDHDLMSILLDSASEASELINPQPFLSAAEGATPLDRDQADGSSYTRRSAGLPSSPPNEISEEDKWPYRWDPGSCAITVAKRIHLSDTQLQASSQGPQFQISEQRHARLKHYLLEPRRRGMGLHELDFPNLATTNALICIFFTQFEHQMPVIHRPTLRSADDLPDSLLAVIVAIGATYSRAKHTCRFAIVLIDMARLSAQISLELNNRLMRDPMFVYSLTLICYAGLWCGNKRLFELSENLRGTVVTYARHAQRSEYALAREEAKRHGTDTERQWHRWIQRESKKRLSWCIYNLDCMFPYLLYLPASLSMAEFTSIECPCDEEFWHATSAYGWKSLLGSASAPPGRTFVSVVSPFLGPIPSPVGGQRGSASSVPGLNSWTRHLVLVTILVQVFELSQQINMVSKATRDPNIWQNGETAQTSPGSPEDSMALDQNVQPRYAYLVTRCSSQRESRYHFSPSNQQVLKSLSQRRFVVEKMLCTWEASFAALPAVDISVYKTSGHFHDTALTLLKLGRLSLHVPLSDLQNALGKADVAGIAPAMESMRQLLQRHSEETAGIFVGCLRTIDDLQVKPGHSGPTNASSSATLVTAESTREPVEIITCFLSQVLVWMLAHCADSTHSQLLLKHMHEAEVSGGGFVTVVEAALKESTTRANISTDGGECVASAHANTVLFAAADGLSEMGPWAASLNLALLLWHRGRVAPALVSGGQAES